MLGRSLEVAGVSFGGAEPRARVILFATLVLVLSVMGHPMAGRAAQIGVVDLDEVAKAHFVYLGQPDRPELRDTVGPDPRAVAAQEAKLKALRERLGRERATLSQAEQRALQAAIAEETAALQRLLGKTSREVFERLKMRSPAVFFPHLTRRIHEYGRERKLARMITKKDGRILYRDPDYPEDAAGETVDLTASLIEWLRAKDRTLADDVAASPPPENGTP